LVVAALVRDIKILGFWSYVFAIQAFVMRLLFVMMEVGVCLSGYIGNLIMPVRWGRPVLADEVAVYVPGTRATNSRRRQKLAARKRPKSGSLRGENGGAPGTSSSQG